MEQAGPTFMGIDIIMAATVMAAVATFAVLVAIYAATTVRDPMARRAKKRAKLIHQSDTTDRMRGVLQSLSVLQDEQLAAAQQKLAQAGIRSKDMAIAIIFGRLVMPIVLGGTAALAIYVFEIWATDWTPFKKFMLFAAILIGSYKAPDLYVGNMIAKRTDAIRKGLPDALDLLVICAEAGLTVDAAFNRVAKELGRAYPELGDEFTLTAIELSFLTERKQAFDNLAYRVALDAVRGVVTTMVQTEKYGTPLASALRVLSAEFRNERMMRAEEKAARLPAIMTVPLILFILPVLFIVILGPAACSISDAFG